MGDIKILMHTYSQQVSAAGVNRMDLIQVAGKYPPPPGDSEILGVEGLYLYISSALFRDQNRETSCYGSQQKKLP